MKLVPKMQNRIHGFSMVEDFQRRHWNGLTADLWTVKCADVAGGYYVGRDPRLFLLLGQSGSGHPTLKKSLSDNGLAQTLNSHPMSFIPSDMELWVDIHETQEVTHLDIHFDTATITRRLGNPSYAALLDIPKLAVSNDRAMVLARLIANEILNPCPLNDLYGDSLSLALLIEVLQLPQQHDDVRNGLSNKQLTIVKEFIESHCQRNIRLDELASLVNMSESHFSHLFKASTGVPPHEWLIRTRLKYAEKLLRNDATPLTRIAVETGFTDHAHFSRVFKKYYGVTPSYWRRN